MQKLNSCFKINCRNDNGPSIHTIAFTNWYDTIFGIMILYNFSYTKNKLNHVKQEFMYRKTSKTCQKEVLQKVNGDFFMLAEKTREKQFKAR